MTQHNQPSKLSSIVRRWKCVRYCPCEGPRSKAGHFERSDDGTWVLAEDYELLRSALKAAAAHLDQPVLYTISESASANSILRGDALQALTILRGASAPETTRPKCTLCDDTGSMSDGTACPHLSHETFPNVGGK